MKTLAKNLIMSVMTIITMSCSEQVTDNESKTFKDMFEEGQDWMDYSESNYQLETENNREMDFLYYKGDYVTHFKGSHSKVKDDLFFLECGYIFQSIVVSGYQILQYDTEERYPYLLFREFRKNGDNIIIKAMWWNDIDNKNSCYFKFSLTDHKLFDENGEVLPETVLYPNLKPVPEKKILDTLNFQFEKFFNEGVGCEISNITSIYNLNIYSGTNYWTKDTTNHSTLYYRKKVAAYISYGVTVLNCDLAFLPIGYQGVFIVIGDTKVIKYATRKNYENLMFDFYRKNGDNIIIKARWWKDVSPADKKNAWFRFSLTDQKLFDEKGEIVPMIK